MILSFRRAQDLAALHIYVLMQTLSISLFFVTARYRVTVLPVVCLFAAYALTWLVGKVISRRYPAIVSGIGICMALFWLTSPARLPLNMEELRRWHRINVGLRYSKSDMGSDRAESLLREVVIEHPQDPESRLHYGIVLRRSGKFPDALRELQAASELDPGDPVIPFQIGKIYATMGADSLAATRFITSLALAPLYKEAHEHLALAYVNLRRYEDALKEFAVALTIDPTDSPLRVNLGVTYGKLGMTDEAIRQFKLALHYDNANWKARYNLAAALVEKDQLQDARQELEAILKTDPNNEAARDALSELQR
jgi:tetratricopeptide (TPR) repeat protein